MEQLLEWIKNNAAEGANVEEAEKLVQGLTKLPENREEAAKLLDEDKTLKSELDARISKSVDNAIERYEQNKLPEKEKELRDKVQKELNPEETEEQRKIRELNEKLEAMESKEQTEQRKAQLRTKAKELGFDPIKAERYAAFGEDAEKVLEEDAEWFKSSINNEVEKSIKERYGGKVPEAPKEKTENTMGRSEFEQMAPQEKHAFVKDGGTVVNEGE